jgi:hypothetical protein
MNENNSGRGSYSWESLEIDQIERSIISIIARIVAQNISQAE